MRPYSSKIGLSKQRSILFEHHAMQLDDHAMQQRLRSLAVSLKTSGTAKLKGCSRSAIRAPLAAAQSIAIQSEQPPASLQWLLENGRLIESFFLSLPMSCSCRLPAASGMPRIAHIMKETVLCSDANISVHRLCGALRAFDEVRALRIDELWAAPAALATALCAQYRIVSDCVLTAQRERMAALKWAAADAPLSASLLRRSPAFFECALGHLHRQDMSAKYRELTGWLSQHGHQAERLIAIEHERQALYCLILSNILSTLRLLSRLDWSKCFADLSQTEKILLQDSTYAQMDEPSRMQIRQRISDLAKKCGIEETSAAKCALDAANEYQDIRRELCWWLHTAAGCKALIRRIGIRASVHTLVPDAFGHRYMSGVLLLTFIGFVSCLKLPGIAAFAALPVLWAAAASIVHRLIPCLRRPIPLLKMQFDKIPDACRTLLVMPCLLSSPERAEEMCSQLETLGCLVKDKNISFLLLGDLPEHTAPDADGDELIVSAAQTAVDDANRRAGWEKYCFVHRPRVLQQCEGRYMGHERKRGALNDLNALLVHGENRFVQPSAQMLHGRFAFVATLDAGTKMLPDTLLKLIGTIAHPLNRLHIEPDGSKGGFSVIAPRMESSADSVINRFTELYGGKGGIDSYPTAVSDIYQDLTGQGMFGGKGIYDAAAFESALRGRLPDNAILSHDMIEGILARCAFACDLTLYDAPPKTARAYFQRLERWTRGDWQLLPLLFSRRIKLRALDKYKIIDNLRRSLVPIAQLLLVYIGFYSRCAAAVVLGFLPQLLDLALGNLFSKDSWQCALIQLSILPQQAFFQTSAALRALWRMTVSKKHLLQWVTADDAERRGGRLSPIIGWTASILLLPAMVAPALWLPVNVLLAALWWIAPSLTDSLEQPFAPFEPLTPEQRTQLRDLAKRTFRFLTEYTPQSGLTPDNVQLDPCNKCEGGIARRTSPTNIGLYLASCVSARELGLIDSDEMHRRLLQTICSLERMEKWHGQLYNWYHTDTLHPLRPRYVSSVDSGNLAACLLLCSRALQMDGCSETAQRMEKLVREMDFTKLFDKEKELFVIGMDVENDALSSSHYDLLASESRILSFTAMSLGQIPLSHWTRLSRVSTAAAHSSALLSWSGTMFEYLMPSLFLPTYRNTLLYQTQEAVIDAQIAHNASDRTLPWGVSESGYYSFDLSLNYQYHAFGLSALSLRSDAASEVIAPYASMLALSARPQQVMDNLQHMLELNMISQYGLFEAADGKAQRIGEKARMKIIKSHMAHHQGMILCSICNALCDNALIRLFCDRPQARALTLLLQEKPAARVRLKERIRMQESAERRTLRGHTRRLGQVGTELPDTHLLCGSGTTALLTADGAAFIRKDGILLNRRQSEVHLPPQGMFIHAHDRTHNLHFLLSGSKDTPKGTKQRVWFEAGSALYHTQTPQLDIKNQTFISPEDGAFLQSVSLVNCSASPIELDITGCFQPALCGEEDYTAHPVFQDLFVESTHPSERVLCLRRRSRERGQSDPLLIYQVCGAEAADISFETDILRLCGREKQMCEAGVLPDTLSNTAGTVLTPCAALRLHFTLPPHGTQTLCFSAALIEPKSAGAFIERYSSPQNAERALELASTQCREQLRFLALSDRMHHLLQRAAALLLYPRLHAPMLEQPPEHGFSKNLLWALGISGDLPILLVHAKDTNALQPIRELIQAHEFYRTMGIYCDLVVINDHGNDYDQPVRDRLHELISGSHLCALISSKGGVHLLDGQNLSREFIDILHCASAFTVDASAGSLDVQLSDILTAARTILPALPMIEPSLPADAPPNGLLYNGFGSFISGGYLITHFPTPAPWCNILCNPHFGSIITERGGGFIWHNNSRNGRITPFDNDLMQDGWSDLILLRTAAGKVYAPAASSASVLHSPGKSVFEGGCDEFSWSLTQFVDCKLPVKCQLLTLTAHKKCALRLQARLDLILNVTRSAASMTAQGFERGLCWAHGAIDRMVFSCFDAPDDAHTLRRHSRMEHGLLTTELTLSAGEVRQIDLLIAVCENLYDAEALLARWHDSGASERHLADTLAFWEYRLTRITLTTPNPLLNQMVNRFLPYQTMCSRLYARTGFYQPGGAYGFRDQLQDMLSMLYIEPDAVRRHILLCAAHQFESGDVQHWWHPEYTGVRTKISDDLLFLPFVTAEYIQHTEDMSILHEAVPFLKDVAIPHGKEDIYIEAQPVEPSFSLHEHCLRAIRCACRFGQHGLMLMGSGDWNDGMNRVGSEGIGESIWLTEFMIVVLEKYAPLCDDETNKEFMQLASALREAIELHGWDGKWYRRAYMDSGEILGSSTSFGGCCIDSLAQSWAVFAGLSRDRVKSAMQEVEKQLIDRKNGIIKLLTPPFDGEQIDPGYIRGYPPGIRENGGQYTHAACWVVIALAELGLADKAWEAFFMLLPFTHSDTEEKALTYRVEPYVLAADIYSEPPHIGRGGWTWYTGAAGWMIRAVYAHLMGLNIRGRYASLNALLPMAWDEASVTLRIGSAAYTLTAKRSCGSAMLDGQPLAPEGVQLIDDGQAHQAVFPIRKI